MEEERASNQEGESGAAAAAPAAPAGSVSSAAATELSAAAQRKQAEEEAEKKEAEQLAHATKKALDAAHAKGKQRAAYWDTLELVLTPVVGRLKCMVMCTRGGEDVCGKLLSTKICASQRKTTTPSRAAKACE